MSRESRLQGRGGEINNGDSRYIRGHVNWRQSQRAGSDVEQDNARYPRNGQAHASRRSTRTTEVHTLRGTAQRAVTVHTPSPRAP